MAIPEIIYGPLKSDDLCVTIRCPSCGGVGWIDRDQYEGRVSVACPESCDYHETHDLGGRSRG